MRLPFAPLFILFVALEAVAEPPAQKADPPSWAKWRQRYVGTHALGVNRVNEGRRVAQAKIREEGGRLLLFGRVERDPYWLELEGEVKPIDARAFELEGVIRGVPNLAFMGAPLAETETKGRFYFFAKGARRYWRLYRVNGRDCVCFEGCGNDFCYIDIGFGPPKRR